MFSLLSCFYFKFQVPFPQPPMSFQPSMPIFERLEKIQNYMNTLQYPSTYIMFYSASQSGK